MQAQGPTRLARQDQFQCLWAFHWGLPQQKIDQVTAGVAWTTTWRKGILLRGLCRPRRAIRGCSGGFGGRRSARLPRRLGMAVPSCHGAIVSACPNGDAPHQSRPAFAIAAIRRCEDSVAEETMNHLRSRASPSGAARASSQTARFSERIASGERRESRSPVRTAASTSCSGGRRRAPARRRAPPARSASCPRASSRAPGPFRSPAGVAASCRRRGCRSSSPGTRSRSERSPCSGRRRRAEISSSQPWPPVAGPLIAAMNTLSERFISQNRSWIRQARTPRPKGVRSARAQAGNPLRAPTMRRMIPVSHGGAAIPARCTLARISPTS